MAGSQSGINPWIEGAKHVFKETVPWVAYGALALAALPLIAGVLPFVPVINGGVIAGLQTGAAIGAVFGLVKSIPGIDGAIKNAEQDKMFMEQQKLTFAQKQMLMAQQQQMAMGQGGAVMPNVPYQQQNQRVAGV